MNVIKYPQKTVDIFRIYLSSSQILKDIYVQTKAERLDMSYLC